MILQFEYVEYAIFIGIPEFCREMPVYFERFHPKKCKKECAAMKGSPRPVTGLLLVLLLLYAVYTFAPALLYGMAEKKDASPTEGAPSPSPGLEAESTAPIPAESLLPNFLEGASLPDSPREESFTLYDVATDQVLTVTAEDFLAAAVACEMDLSSPPEALKAQAVAAYTYYTRQKGSGQAKGADFACDSENWLVYVPQSAMEARWGEDYEANLSLLRGIVREVEGQMLTWQGKPALTTYFAISSGSTEAAANVWDPGAGESCPYLRPVASPGDQLSDGYYSTSFFSEEQFREAALGYFTEAAPDFSGPAETWLSDFEYTASGTVKTALLGGVKVSGGDLRSAFSLRSACFSLSAGEEGFTFTVRGWGHGVGMSQAGAVFLAKQGADYKEILAHYYPGTVLTFPA